MSGTRVDRAKAHTGSQTEAGGAIEGLAGIGWGGDREGIVVGDGEGGVTGIALASVAGRRRLAIPAKPLSQLGTTKRKLKHRRASPAIFARKSA